MTRTLEIVPSMLAADFARLGELARACGARWVSVDVMDGHFVPNLSFGPDHVKAIKQAAPGVFIDAHLMVTNPEAVIPWFAAAGSDIITFHLEATKDPRAVIKQIKSLGKKAGAAIKPKTPVDGLLELLPELDLALVMTVEPGFGGQKFMADMLPKVRALRAAVDAKNLECWIQVDGGVTLDNVAEAAAAGADSLVAGSSVFGKLDPAKAVQDLFQKAKNGGLK
jgi:ribulose-phosphate 3-epimerase